MSEVGSQVTTLALPLVAIIALEASTFQVALLTAATSSAFLLVALQAGALVDRWRLRLVLIRTDVARALVLVSVPVAQLFGVLTLVQLYVVAVLLSVLTVFFDVAYQSYLPALVRADQLVAGNARLAGSASSAQVAGPGLGGVLVAALGAAYTLLLDVLSFVGSAVLLARIRVPDPPVRPRADGSRLRTEIREGLGFVLGHPVLRMVVGCTATANFFGTATAALLVVFLTRELGAGPQVVGLVFALGAVGGLVGAAVAGPLARAVGSARILWLALLVEVPFLFAIPLAFPGWGVLLVSVSSTATGAAAVVYNVGQVSYRQAVTPDRLLGRMNASTRFIVWGVMPLGALAAGALGVGIGVRATLLLAAVGGSTAVLWLLAGPLRTTRDIVASTPI